METIKVNLPRNKDNFDSGNGEGCFVFVDDETFKLYKADYSGGSFKGTLDNDSFYFPTLKAGQEIYFTMRGENRPVAFIDKLLENHTPITDAEFKQLLIEINKHNNN